MNQYLCKRSVIWSPNRTIKARNNGAIGDRPRNFEPRVSDENNLWKATHSLNFHTSPTESPPVGEVWKLRVSKDLMYINLFYLADIHWHKARTHDPPSMSLGFLGYHGKNLKSRQPPILNNIESLEMVRGAKPPVKLILNIIINYQKAMLCASAFLWRFLQNDF
ncbi:hypothetical protein TNCV_4807801 [Trichonephila clavipes]|nr:hypothetical protein TNCV_4807801 [Trichonephila clavipes]